MPEHDSEQRIPAPAQAAGTPRNECVLLKHGEIFLKGRNRASFEARLHDNLRTALRGVGGSTWIKNARNITVLGGEVPLESLVERASRVIGFSTVQPAVRVPSTVEAVTATALDLMRRHPQQSFAVRPRRREKNFPLTSTRLAEHVGARVQQELGLTVNLGSPDVELSIEVDTAETYVSTRRLPGPGGLPVGSSGRALVLLSGGYDSPIAAYRAMRRGLHCDFVHFTGAPYTDASSAYKAYALQRLLNRYQPEGQLYLVPLGSAQKQLALSGAGKYQVVAQRRLMVRTASALATRTGAEALVSGDSLGQVASQTLTNMAAVDEAAELPVLRPLVGWEKDEIIQEARRVGTADVSVLPDEDCCQLLAPETTTTKARVGQLHRLERRLDVDNTVEDLLAHATCLTGPAESGTGNGDPQGTDTPDAGGAAEAPDPVP